MSDVNFGNLIKSSKKWKKYKVPKKLRRKKRFNKSEEKCREIFEKIFKVEFKSCRPEFLKNPTTGKKLELDGYAPNIETYLGKGMAFEYDGIQHSKHTSVFHSSKSEFKYQIAKDLWKDMKCKEVGIALIRIPHYIVYDDLEKYIIDTLIKKRMYIGDVKINRSIHSSHSPYNNFYRGTGKGLYD